MKKTIFIIIILLCFCTPAISSQVDTGLDLLKACKNAISVFEHRASNIDIIEVSMGSSFCVGYIRGVSDTTKISYFGIMGKNGDLVAPFHYFCTPNEVGTEQEIRIVIKYLENHPEKLNQPMLYIIINALSAAFPCK